MEEDFMKKNAQKDEDVGVLLIGHGSSLPYGNKVIYKLLEYYKEDSELPVEVGFMNVEDPTIRAAINNLAKIGVNKIIAVPLFYCTWPSHQGRHTLHVGFR